MIRPPSRAPWSQAGCLLAAWCGRGLAETQKVAWNGNPASITLFPLPWMAALLGPSALGPSPTPPLPSFTQYLAFPASSLAPSSILPSQSFLYLPFRLPSTTCRPAQVSHHPDPDEGAREKAKEAKGGSSGRLGPPLLGLEAALGQHPRSEPRCSGSTTRPYILPLSQSGLTHRRVLPPRGVFGRGGCGERRKGKRRMCVAASVPGRGPGGASGVQGPKGGRWPT